MKKTTSYVALLLVLFLAGVSYHSVTEIHYLKSFFPQTFTMEEALFASIVDLIKYLFIISPILFTWKVWRDIHRTHP